MVNLHLGSRCIVCREYLRSLVWRVKVKNYVKAVRLAIGGGAEIKSLQGYTGGAEWDMNDRMLADVDNMYSKFIVKVVALKTTAGRECSLRNTINGT